MVPQPLHPIHCSPIFFIVQFLCKLVTYECTIFPKFQHVLSMMPSECAYRSKIVFTWVLLFQVQSHTLKSV